jgi:hypothetical protein
MPARISSVEWFSTTKTSTLETTGEAERADRVGPASDDGEPDVDGEPDDATAPDDDTVGADGCGALADEQAAEVSVRARAGAAARAVSRIGRDSRR